MTSHERQTHPHSVYTSSGTSEAAIRLLLAALGRGAAEPTMDVLHVTVCERVRAMRDDGAHPEAVLVAMKRLAATAVSDAGTVRSERSSEATALVSQVGQWCIAEYFRRP